MTTTLGDYGLFRSQTPEPERVLRLEGHYIEIVAARRFQNPPLQPGNDTLAGHAEVGDRHRNTFHAALLRNSATALSTIWRTLSRERPNSSPIS